MKRFRAKTWSGLLLILTPLLSPAAETEWLVAPYIWLPDITMDQTSGDSSGGGSISGSDLLDKTDTAGMIRVEAARNHWGFTLDYIFLAVSDDAFVPLPPPSTGGINVLADIDVSVLELGGFYRPSGNDKGINYLFGFRRIDVEKVLLLTPVGGGVTQRFDGDSDFTDVFAGARYLHRFTDHWDLTLRGDIGFGDSEGTLNLLGSVGYRFTGPFALQLGYRHTTMEFEDDVNGAVETTELELSGPFLGFVFRF